MIPIRKNKLDFRRKNNKDSFIKSEDGLKLHNYAINHLKEF